MFWTHKQWVRNTMNFEMDFEFRNEQFWCFTMDFSTHSVLFRNEDKFEIQQSCYFDIEVGINSESIRNGTIFEFIKEISKCFFCTALRLQLANSKWWAFRNRNFCFRIEILLNFRKWLRNLPDLEMIFIHFEMRCLKCFLFTVSHFEIR